MEPSGSALPEEPVTEGEPVEEEPNEAIQSLIKEEHGLTGNTWGCPECGYTLLNPLVSAEFIICPRCGFEPVSNSNKSKYVEVLKKIIRKYHEEFGKTEFSSED